MLTDVQFKESLTFISVLGKIEQNHFEVVSCPLAFL